MGMTISLYSYFVASSDALVYTLRDDRPRGTIVPATLGESEAATFEELASLYIPAEI